MNKQRITTKQLALCSVLLTLMMLVLIALAVYGTDFIVELLRKLFQ